MIYMKLELNPVNDGEKPVKVLHMQTPKVFVNGPATMEIEDLALPVLDLIVITWIFIEQRRYYRLF